ncbi:MAG: hypothetical protein QM499_11555 [Flavobacteriaceae bacterium]
MKKYAFLIFSVFLVACNSTKKIDSQSVYDNYDYSKIDVLADSFKNEHVLVSNKEGIQLKLGSVILFITTDGDLGKMEIVSVNPEENYKTSFNYTVYNDDGSVKISKDNFGLRGTWVFDFDKGSDEATSYENDIWNNRVDDFETYLDTENETLMLLIQK